MNTKMIHFKKFGLLTILKEKNFTLHNRLLELVPEPGVVCVNNTKHQGNEAGGLQLAWPTN